MTSEAIARRHAERDALVDEARRFSNALDPGLEVRAVVVFGSVARGDFNLWSDIDVLVVADVLPPRLLDRLAALGAWARIQPVPWTSTEWVRHRARGNPIVTESLGPGIWLVGGSADLG